MKIQKEKLQISKYLEYMESNGIYYRQLEGLDVVVMIYDKVEFKKVQEGITEVVLGLLVQVIFQL